MCLLHTVTLTVTLPVTATGTGQTDSPLAEPEPEQETEEETDRFLKTVAKTLWGLLCVLDNVVIYVLYKKKIGVNWEVQL